MNANYVFGGKPVGSHAQDWNLRNLVYSVQSNKVARGEMTPEEYENSFAEFKKGLRRNRRHKRPKFGATAPEDVNYNRSMQKKRDCIGDCSGVAIEIVLEIVAEMGGCDMKDHGDCVGDWNGICGSNVLKCVLR